MLATNQSTRSGLLPTATRRSLARAAILILALAAAACDGIPSDLERTPDDVPLSEIIDLSRAGGDRPLRADGMSVDTLVARIPRGASSREITLTTSRGSFLLNPGNKSIKVRAERSASTTDDRLVARAVLVADTTAAPVVVSASVKEFTAYLTIPLVR